MKTKIKEQLSKGVAKTPVVMQLEALECGAASLTMIMAYYGKWVPLEEVRVDCGVVILVVIGDFHFYSSACLLLLESNYFCKRLLMNLQHLLDGSAAGMPTALQSFHKQDTHHLDKETFTVYIVVPIARGFSFRFLA